ncbi:MAG: DUF4349 domain-containing protein [Candidatus Bathyarchaeia archaeon]
MVSKRIVAVSAVVAVLLIASFFIGTLYSPYRTTGVSDFYREKGVVAPKMGEVVPTPTPAPTPAEYAVERMVIYNAYISLETPELEGVLAKIRVLAESYGGYVVGTSRSSYGAQATAEITIRIPQDKFHMAVQQIEGYGEVLDEHTSSEDVTERYIDLKARLGNLERQEKRLHEVLDMAKTVEEILEVERELARVRGEIESLQGQINYLERSVAMSLITVSLREPPPPFTPPGVDWGETFEIALTGFFAVIRGLIILVVSIIPIAVIGLIAYYVYRRRKGG